jgi:hypothetical protein
MRNRLRPVPLAIAAVVLLLYGGVTLFAEEAPSFPDSILPDLPDEIPTADPLGFGIWIESYSHTSEINGGTYLSVSAGLFLGNFALLDLRYSTDLLPTTFDDHLIAVSAEINLSRRSLPGPSMTAGPIYLFDVSEFSTHHYVGLSWSLLNSWKAAFSIPGLGLFFDVFSLRFLWDVTDGEYLFGFSMIEPQIF